MRAVVQFAIWLLLGLGAAPAAGQTPAAEPATRAELLRREREEKQREVEPYEQNSVERAMHLAEQRILPLLNRDGVYARFGSLATGSGFAYGGGYRDRSLLYGRGRMDVWAAGSLRRYWALEARGAYPLTRNERVTLEAFARKYANPEEEFFGLGPESERSNQVAYDLRGTTAGAIFDAAVGRSFSFGGRVESMWTTTGPSNSGRLRSIEEIFDPGALPSFANDQRFVRTGGHVLYDYRQPLNARRGGYYRLDLSHYTERDGVADFTRADLDLRQYVSFLAERRILVGRMLVSTTEPASGASVPFFLQPALGGNDTLRGFRANRFRGPHSILLQGEYRFEVWSGLDFALFTDWGKVALDRSDLNFEDLERDFGFGFRFNTDNGVIVRVDTAFGSADGTHLHIVFGGLF